MGYSAPTGTYNDATPKAGKGNGKAPKSQRTGMPAATPYLLDMAGCFIPMTSQQCGYLKQACTMTPVTYQHGWQKFY